MRAGTGGQAPLVVVVLLRALPFALAACGGPEGARPPARLPRTERIAHPEGVEGFRLTDCPGAWTEEIHFL